MQAVEAIRAIGKAITGNKELLTSLDAAIGDADHGINMARGFDAVEAKLAAPAAGGDIGLVLKTVGMTLISTVGGASGPLYGTAFLRAAAACQGKTAIDRDTAVKVWAAAIGGIRERGKATGGEKTMLDALEPAAAAFTQAAAAGRPLLDCLEAGCRAAEAGVEATKAMVATKGRASYLGERSLGHQDPGATSSAIILAALADFCRRNGLGAQ